MSLQVRTSLGVEPLRLLWRPARPRGLRLQDVTLVSRGRRYASSKPAPGFFRSYSLDASTRRGGWTGQRTTARFAPVSLLAAGGVVAALLTFVQPAASDDHHQHSLSKGVSDSQHAFTTDARDPSIPRFRLSTVRQHDASHPEPWVTFEDKVYDITSWIPAHPGGDVILRAAGGSIDPYWDIFAIHKAPHVREILEEYRIGYIDAADLVDGRPPADMIEDPFADDPERDSRLITHTTKPRNAEPPSEWVARDFFTPPELFYVRNHMWVPVVGEKEDDEENGSENEAKAAQSGVKQSQGASPEQSAADNHVLTVELLDGEKKTYTLGELKRRFRHHTITSALQCSGNRRGDMTQQAVSTNGLQWATGAISNAEWEGVRLADVLYDAGLRVADHASLTTTESRIGGKDGDSNDDGNLITSPNTHHIHFQGLEAYGSSIPLPTALDPRADVLLAFRMNGRPLARDHGFPLRALVPGHVAARSVKWLSRVTVADEESPAQWQRRDYKSFGPNEGAHPDWERAAAIQEMPVTSAITGVWVGDKAGGGGNSVREGWVGKTSEGNEKTNSEQSGKEETSERDDPNERSKSEPIALQGYAYSGGGREIRRVDVSLDGGETWDQAALVDDCATAATAATSNAPSCRGSRMWAWKRWTYEGRMAMPGPDKKGQSKPTDEAGAGKDGRRCVTLVVKATDDSYNAQPKTQAEIYNVRGNLATAWHRVRVCPCRNSGGENGEKTVWSTTDLLRTGDPAPEVRDHPSEAALGQTMKK